MPVQSQIAAALIAFGVIGFFVSSLSPFHRASADPSQGYAFAISSGAGLRLSDVEMTKSAGSDDLACARVVRIAGIDIGSRCERAPAAFASTF